MRVRVRLDREDFRDLIQGKVVRQTVAADLGHIVVEAILADIGYDVMIKELQAAIRATDPDNA